MKRKVICFGIICLFLLTNMTIISSTTINNENEYLVYTTESNSLSGYVYCELLGDTYPLEGAFVFIMPLNLSGCTDNNGFYLIDVYDNVGVVTINVGGAKHNGHSCSFGDREFELQTGSNTLDLFGEVDNVEPEIKEDQSYYLHQGDTRTYFYFEPYYYDIDGDIPISKNVVIDEVEYEMHLSKEDADSPSDGHYLFTVNGFEVGTHYFYYNFDDGFGGNIRYPKEEDLSFDVHEEGWYPYLELVSLPDNGKEGETFEFKIHYIDKDHERSPSSFYLVVDGNPNPPRKFQTSSSTPHDAVYSYSSTEFDVGVHEVYAEAWIVIDPDPDPDGGSSFSYKVRLPARYDTWSFEVAEKGKTKIFMENNPLKIFIENHPNLLRLIQKILEL